MHHQYSFSKDPVGCGMVGCFGGLLLGLIGGVLLIVGAALVTASFATIPDQTATTNPDLRVTIAENFLNRFAEQPTDGSLSIDILPDNQVQLTGVTSLQSLGIDSTVEIIGLFELQLNPQNLSVRLLDTEVVGLSLPVELNNLFEEDVFLINQDLGAMVDEMSRVLGTPIILTTLSTSDTHIHLEIQEAR